MVEVLGVDECGVESGFEGGISFNLSSMSLFSLICIAIGWEVDCDDTADSVKGGGRAGVGAGGLSKVLDMMVEVKI